MAQSFGIWLLERNQKTSILYHPRLLIIFLPTLQHTSYIITISIDIYASLGKSQNAGMPFAISELSRGFETIGSCPGKLASSKSATILRGVRLLYFFKINSITHLPNTVVPLTLRSIIIDVGIQKSEYGCLDHLRVSSSGVLFNLWAASGPMASTYYQRTIKTLIRHHYHPLTYLIEAACKSNRWVCCCWEIKIVSKNQYKSLVDLKETQTDRHQFRRILTIRPRPQSICNCSIRVKIPPRQTCHQHRFSPQTSDLHYHLSQISTHRFRRCYFLIIMTKLNCHQCASSLCHFSTNSSDGNVPETTSARACGYRFEHQRGICAWDNDWLTHPLQNFLW